MTTWKMAGLTDAGRMRDTNEDAVGWRAEQGWAVLADGMGGHQAGDVASSTVVDVVGQKLDGVESTQAAEALRAAVEQANSAICEYVAQQPQLHTMGSTVVAVVLREDILHYAHAGDSRLYRLRGGSLEQLTHDHSLVQELVDEGMMSEEQARTSEQRNIITRALGLDAQLELAQGEDRVLPGDSYLLCSDGLSNMLRDDEIAALLTGDSLPEVATALVAAANRHGGSDNISVIVIRIWE